MRLRHLTLLLWAGCAALAIYGELGEWDIYLRRMMTDSRATLSYVSEASRLCGRMADSTDFNQVRWSLFRGFELRMMEMMLRFAHAACLLRFSPAAMCPGSVLRGEIR